MTELIGKPNGEVEERTTSIDEIMRSQPVKSTHGVPVITWNNCRECRHYFGEWKELRPGFKKWLHKCRIRLTGVNLRPVEITYGLCKYWRKKE
jgi:hypothetical protein